MNSFSLVLVRLWGRVELRTFHVASRRSFSDIPSNTEIWAVSFRVTSKYTKCIVSTFPAPVSNDRAHSFCERANGDCSKESCNG
uniref:Putative secreted peptide n=1 Tax=Anopheles braziliensis TaxID=58242 RepID=A0A2M3ZVQ1_9DIPT